MYNFIFLYFTSFYIHIYEQGKSICHMMLTNIMTLYEINASFNEIGWRSCEITYARCRGNWRRIAGSCSVLLDQTDCDQAVRSTWLGHSALLSDRINVAVSYTAPAPPSPLSPPLEGTFLRHRETQVSSRQHFIGQRARPASQFHFSRPLIVDSLIRLATIG